MTDNLPVPSDWSLTPPPRPEPLGRQFLGNITDREAPRLTKVWVTMVQEEKHALDIIWSHTGTDYQSASDFIRHWVLEGIVAHMEQGFPLGGTGESVSALMKLREHFFRLKLRSQFEEMFLTMEETLVDWISTGDVDALEKELTYIEEFLTQTQDMSQHWMVRFQDIVMRSGAVKTAVAKLDDEKWDGWLERMGEAGQE